MKYHNTHCALRLGDNICHLHFLRKLALANPDDFFTHACHPGYLPQLADVVCDVPNIALQVMNPAALPLNSIDVWKNAGGFWENHPLKNDYAGFMIQHFRRLAGVMGLPTAIFSAADQVFDYPALLPKTAPAQPFDFLIVNSPPLSGQFRGYSDDQFHELIRIIARQYKVVTTHRSPVPVACTQDHGCSVTQIGHFSQCCRAIIMVSTGPSWPTFNVWNADKIELRVILIDSERVELAKNTFHTNKVSAVRDILISKGFL